jgi:hypothetical protein
LSLDHVVIAIVIAWELLGFDWPTLNLRIHLGLCLRIAAPD